MRKSYGEAKFFIRNNWFLSSLEIEKYFSNLDSQAYYCEARVFHANLMRDISSLVYPKWATSFLKYRTSLCFTDEELLRSPSLVLCDFFNSCTLYLLYFQSRKWARFFFSQKDMSWFMHTWNGVQITKFDCCMLLEYFRFQSVKEYYKFQVFKWQFLKMWRHWKFF